jgi:hypothetical protein
VKVARAIALVVVVAGFLAVGALRYWNIWGQGDLGAKCSGRAGCKSFWCLSHAFRGGVEGPSEGYCTDKCKSDADCKPGMKCVAPSQAALDDLARAMRPQRLCQRFE